jgi:hypothetical protein
MEDQSHVESTSEVNIHQVVIILGEGTKDISIEYKSCKNDFNLFSN